MKYWRERVRAENATKSHEVKDGVWHPMVEDNGVKAGFGGGNQIGIVRGVCTLHSKKECFAERSKGQRQVTSRWCWWCDQPALTTDSWYDSSLLHWTHIVAQHSVLACCSLDGAWYCAGHSHQRAGQSWCSAPQGRLTLPMQCSWQQLLFWLFWLMSVNVHTTCRRAPGHPIWYLRNQGTKMN